MQRIAVGYRAGRSTYVTTQNARAVSLPTIDWRGRTHRPQGECGGQGRAIYHPDEEKSITFQRHPPSPLHRAREARDLRESRYLTPTPLRHSHVHYIW